MSETDFRVVFLGENPCWSKLSQALADAPGAQLRLRRLDSLTDLFRALAAEQWHAVALDVHAWNFQGLHFVEKVRSEYPALPIVALYSPSIPELDSKAITSGASRCLSLDHLTADAFQSALTSALVEAKFQSHIYKGSPQPLSSDGFDSPVFPSSKTQVITHALNNLLCVINANADILADQLESTGPGPRSLTEIKKSRPIRRPDAPPEMTFRDGLPRPSAN